MTESEDTAEATAETVTSTETETTTETEAARSCNAGLTINHIADDRLYDAEDNYTLVNYEVDNPTSDQLNATIEFETGHGTCTETLAINPDGETFDAYEIDGADTEIRNDRSSGLRSVLTRIPVLFAELLDYRRR